MLPDELTTLIHSNSHKILLIDCQHPKQFERLHIKTSINLPTPEKLIDYLFGSENQLVKFLTGSVSLILYCKNGKRISPFMVRLIRKIDRQVHQEKYPLIAFRSIYLLNGGLSIFKIKCQVL